MGANPRALWNAKGMIMKVKERRGSQLWRAARLSTVALIAVAATGPACLSRPLEPIEPRTTSTVIEKLTQSSVDKIDLLLAIDNSRSMADKQQILNLAVPDLVNRLVNPLCVDDTTKTAVSNQPSNPTDQCPAGTQREFQPVLDIHIGVVDSSIGGHGSDACKNEVTNAPECNGTSTNYSNNDHGHLITRKDPCKADQVPTYQDFGFLAWDPTQKKANPPGEADVANLNKSITDLVSGTGQVGCGFEAQNEGWYRFLVDPNPYLTITVEGGKAVPHDRDDVLLKQRSDFLRPNSLLAIVMLTDENDCSVREGGQYYVVNQLQNGSPYHLPPARSECATNPLDKCCKSCGQPAGDCPMDPVCSKPIDPVMDDINLRCFNNKQRFGIDFLYPWQRYVNALTQPAINPGSADLSIGSGQSGTPNPIFSDLQPNDENTTVRDSGLVFLAGIVGVPWQDVARDPADLTKGYKNAAELAKSDANMLTGWDVILGDPDKYVPPADPHMREQVDPRNAGDTNPVTGDAIAAPGSAEGADKINGHEYTIKTRGDLQYACIFELPTPRDCSKGQDACDCQDATNDKPLCSPNPGDGNKPTLQTKAKGYPGTRHLQILKGLGDQGIVASVCPKQVNDPMASDFGYRPAVGAIIDRLKTKLGGQCLPRTLTPDKDGHVPCLILEARKQDGACNCDPNQARLPLSDEHKQAEAAAQADPLYATQKWNCFCEIEQTSGDSQKACQNDTDPNPVVAPGNTAVNGWCYVDATTAPITGNPKLVANCPDTEQRLIRFVGNGKGAPGATLFITCSGE